MVYWIIGLALLAALAGWLAWQNIGLRRSLSRAQARQRELQRERGLRQNLQRICDSREAEIRRLRARVADYEADFEEMESRASDLNMSLFRESGLRILAEKEDGAKRLKMEQLEQQLSDARRKLKQRDDEARETEKQLQAIITRQQQEISRIQAAHAKRAARRAKVDAVLMNQISLDELIDIPPSDGGKN